MRLGWGEKTKVSLNNQPISRLNSHTVSTTTINGLRSLCYATIPSENKKVA